MHPKSAAILVGKLVLFTLLFTICFFLGTIVSGLAATNSDQADSAAGSALFWLVANSAVTVSLLAWPTIRTSWSKSRSMLTIFVLLFFIGTFLPQLDSLFFSDSLQISTGGVATIMLSGVITALLYTPVSVWAFHRGNTATPEWVAGSSVPMRRIVLLSFIYLIIYYFFGYFVAWQSADLRVFYSGSEGLLPFWEHLYANWVSSPALFGLQIIRGLIWASLAFLIGRMIDTGRRWEKVLAIGLLFSLTNALLLLVPNPYMPEVVRKIHFLEVTTSNFLFGCIAGGTFFFRKKTPAQA